MILQDYATNAGTSSSPYRLLKIDYLGGNVAANGTSAWCEVYEIPDDDTYGQMLVFHGYISVNDRSDASDYFLPLPVSVNESVYSSYIPAIVSPDDVGSMYVYPLLVSPSKRTIGNFQDNVGAKYFIENMRVYVKK